MRALAVQLKPSCKYILVSCLFKSYALKASTKSVLVAGYGNGGGVNGGGVYAGKAAIGFTKPPGGGALAPLPFGAAIPLPMGPKLATALPGDMDTPGDMTPSCSEQGTCCC